MTASELTMLAGTLLGSAVGGFVGAKARELTQNRALHALYRRVFGVDVPGLPVPPDTPAPAALPCTRNGVCQ